MAESKDFSSFFQENKKILNEYVETRMEILRLQAIKGFSKIIGNFIWFIISLFMVFLLLIFLSLVLGLWLSDITGNFIVGFGLTTLVIFILLIILNAAKKALFINPIIKNTIRKLK